MRSRPTLRFALILALVLLLPACVKQTSKKGELAPPRTMTAPAKLMQNIMGDKHYDLVNGGWGFDRENAMVFGTSPDIAPDRDDLTTLERSLADVRNTEEFTRSPAVGKRYEVMSFALQSQITLRDAKTGRIYDRIVGTVQIIPENCLPELIKLADGYKAGNPEAVAAYKAKTESVKREYWFDITALNRQAKGKLSKNSKRLVE